jgi:hypothetical protein
MQEATTKLALENDRLRSELGYVRGQLADIHAAASTEELRSLRSRSNSQSQQEDVVATTAAAAAAADDEQPVADSRPQSFVSVTSSASESNDSSAAERLVMEISEEAGKRSLRGCVNVH